MSREARAVIISGFVWLTTILVFLSSFLIVHSVVGEVDFSRLPDGSRSNIFLISFMANILIGIIAFLFCVINLVGVIFKEKKYPHFKVLTPVNIITFSIIGAVLLTFFSTGTSLMLYGESKPSNLGISTSTGIPAKKEVNWNEEMLAKINGERVANHLDVLVEDPKLGLSSSNRLEDIITSKLWSTKSPNGNDYSWYINLADFAYGDAAESMAKGFSTPDDAISALLADKTNKRNILNKNFTNIGISSQNTEFDGLNTRVVIIHFGSKKGSSKGSSNTSDPVITCNFTHIEPMQLKQSVCNKSTDCEINGKWYYYDDVAKCKDDQKKSANNPQYVPMYIPTYNAPSQNMTCTLWDAETNKTTTKYVTTAECTNLLTTQTQKNDAYQKQYQQYQQQLNDEYKQYQADLQQSCQNIDKEWQQYKADFYANDYENFDSSDAAMRSLRAARDIYQKKVNDTGCNMYLSY